MKFSDLPIDRPVAVVMVLVSLTVLGGVALLQLPIDFMPIIEPPQVRVTVPFNGSHPLENLREVVKPLEEEIAKIPGVKKLRSEAQSNQAWVHAEFDWSAARKSTGCRWRGIRRRSRRSATRRGSGGFPRRRSARSIN